ncbi:MAG: PD40 domain-containing protein [Planctomycetes bacterium]|nr:PD40 domain-containing protein [Planctomycetota bacterium]
MKNWGKNIVIVLALLGAGFFLAFIRFKPHLEDATSWTDGEHIYQDQKPENIRYALWENPAAFDSRINSAEDEQRPTLSPDGLFLVFASGQPGLNQDLYISEILNGEPQEPRPLFEVNTAFDEASPAFSTDALYFSSNRDGGNGGFDIWKIPYQGGRFGRAEHLEGLLLNTDADEMDPAPVPGQLAIAFASDRARGARNDFDLYLAQPAGASGLISTAMDEINTPFDEREPAFVGDARTLVYSSNQIEGGMGGYDLWRTVRDRGVWLPPENQGGLNSEADERGPAPSPDGFTLLYYTEKEGESADLYRARSRELFRMPGRPVGWLDFVILASLVLLAILAWLAKRWKAVDLLYKCFMVALIIHALMLFWFQKVYPEPEDMVLPERETMFKVKLAIAPSSTSSKNKEFGGALEAARSEVAELNTPERQQIENTEMSESIDAAPSMNIARADSAPSATSPNKQMVQLEQSEQAKPTEVAHAEIAAPSEQFEKREDAAASLDVAVAEDFAVNRAASEASGAPERVQHQTDPTKIAVAMEQRDQQRVEQRDSNAPEFAPTAAELMAVGSFGDPATHTSAVEVAEMSETVERINNEAPTFEVAAADPTAEFRPTVRDIEGPERQTVRPTHSDLDSDINKQPTFEPGTGIERSDTGFQSSDALAVTAPNRTQSEFESERRNDSMEVENVNLENLTDASVEIGTKGTESKPTTEETLLADLGSENTAKRTEAEASGPSRLADADPTATDTSAEFEVSMSATALTVKRPDRTKRSSGPKRDLSEFMPDAHEASSLPEITLSDAVELPPADTEGAPAEESDAFENELLAGVTTTGAPKRRFGDIEGPIKDMPEMDASDITPNLGPNFAPLVAMEEINKVEPETFQDPTEMEHTPYRNRFGVQKDIALQEHGGSAETEAAVASGLAYLASLQNDAGFWGSRSDKQTKYRHVVVGKTALCLLAFLGANHTPDSAKDYSPNAARAVDFLLNVQDPLTGHFGDTASYGHGIATYALAECYALTKNEKLRQPLEMAVAWILQKQHRSMDPKLDGGWGYYFPDADGYQNDRWPRVSVSSWQVMALESARIGGLTVPDESFERARKFLRGSVDPRFGWVRYSHNPSRLSSSYPTLPASTPACLFAASLVGEDINSDYYKDARRYTLQRVPRGYGFKGDDAFVQKAEGNLYFWYYGSLAMFRVGGEAWERWNGDMKKTLLDAQDDDGSWKPISIYARYAGDDWRDKSYSTAMCVLTLEVYYRYFTPLLSVNGGPTD